MNVFAISDRGKVRQQNEDAVFYRLDEENGVGLAVLCDGMGGEKAGEVASATAGKAFLDYAEKTFLSSDVPIASDVAREAAAYANLQVYDRAMRDEACAGMGTTLVAVVIEPDDACVVNVGDSRCYWLAEGQLLQVTRDHSLVQDMVDHGQLTPSEAGTHPRRNVITRAVGVQRRIVSDIFRLDLRPGDRLLLCSDGLSNQVTRQEMEQILLAEPAPDIAAEKLLAMALDRGAPDNVSVLILER